MSMCVKNKDSLWGRYWGSQKDISNLHFELCYYQPIEWAIKNSIHLFDPGAGGKHKRRRGFFAKSTISLHKWFDKNMENIIYPWLNEVNKQTRRKLNLRIILYPLNKKLFGFTKDYISNIVFINF